MGSSFDNTSVVSAELSVIKPNSTIRSNLHPYEPLLDALKTQEWALRAVIVPTTVFDTYRAVIESLSINHVRLSDAEVALFVISYDIDILELFVSNWSVLIPTWVHIRLTTQPFPKATYTAMIGHYGRIVHADTGKYKFDEDTFYIIAESPETDDLDCIIAALQDPATASIKLELVNA